MKARTVEETSALIRKFVEDNFAIEAVCEERNNNNGKGMVTIRTKDGMVFTYTCQWFTPVEAKELDRDHLESERKYPGDADYELAEGQPEIVEDGGEDE